MESGIPESLLNVIINSPTAVALTDLGMQYLSVSEKWMTDFELDSTILGKSHAEVFSLLDQNWKAMVEEALQGVKIKYERDYLILPNGSIEWLRWELQTWMDDSGHTAGLIIYMQILSKAEVNDVALKRKIDLYEQTNQVARIGAWQLDLLSNELYWSAFTRKLYGVSDDYQPDLQTAFGFQKDGPEKAVTQAYFMELLEKGIPFDAQVQLVNAKGEEIWVRSRGSAEFVNGVCIRVYGTFQDIQQQKIQEIQLANSENKYRSIIENSLYAFLQIVPGKGITNVNQSAIDMFGYTIEEFRQIRRYGLLDTDHPHFEDFIKLRDSTGKASAELIAIRKSGERFPCHISSALYIDSEGILTNSLMIIDISERLRAEEKIRISEEQFRGAFEYSAIGMALFTIDGRCKRANQSLCDMLGYRQEELTKLKFYDMTYPDDLPRNIELMNDLISGVRDSYYLEKRYLHKSGRPVWVLLGVSILRDAEGMPIHFISQIQDITRIKEGERRLAVSEEKYRKIFENIQDIYYRTNQQGIVTEISPSVEKYYGYKRSDVLGRPATAFYFYESDREKLLNALKQDGAITDFEVKLKSNNSELLYASVNGRLIVEDGVIIGSEGSIRDISLRKLQENELTALNTELKALNSHREKLLSIVGHDLRNPVAASLRLAELALMDTDDVTREELLEYISKMRTGLFNAYELLEDLLRWAKIQFNTLEFSPVLIQNLKEEVNSCLKVLKPMAEAKGLHLMQEIAPDIKLFADKDMLDTIIRNLVSNAIKFTSKGSITISAKNFRDNVVFSIADTGSGIGTEVIHLLFNKSMHYTTYGTSGERGTGLGLELCRDFVEKHKGKIWVKSKEGEGSIFYFSIPI